MLLMVVVTAVTVGVLWGEGMLGFNSKSKAQLIIEEANDVGGAMEVYATAYGDGIVNFGDVTCVDPDGVKDPIVNPCEELLHYVKDKKLIKGYVGVVGENDAIQDWVLSEDKSSLEKIVSDEKTCQYINNIKDAKGLDDPVPECGTDGAIGFSCCLIP
jgi:hypothetical protein